MKRPVTWGGYGSLGLATLLLAALLWCCRQDDPPDHQPPLTPSEQTDLALRQTFAYAGKDSLILTTIDHFQGLPEAKDQAEYLTSIGARPLWDKAVHIGDINQAERLFVPIAIRGEDQINWIWIIYADHGQELFSEYLQRGKAPAENAWMFDLFTQEALGKHLPHGVTFKPEGQGRVSTEVFGGKVYRCYQVVVGADPWSTELNLDPTRQRNDWGPSARFGRGVKCFYVADVSGIIDPTGPPRDRLDPEAYAGYGGGGRGRNMGWGHCIIPVPPGPPISGLDTTKFKRPYQPPQPLCKSYHSRIQSPEIYRKILELYDYVKSDEAGNRIERGFTKLFDGELADDKGMLDATDQSHRGLGTVHTHIDLYSRTAGDSVRLYSTQCFSYKDLQQFLFRAGQSLPRVAIQHTQSMDYRDLRDLFSGVVTPRGIYILTIDQRVDSAACAQLLERGNIYYGKHAKNFSDKVMNDKSEHLQRKLLSQLLRGKKTLEQCAEIEELEMLKYIKKKLKPFGYNIKLLFVDLDSPELNTFEISLDKNKQKDSVRYQTKHRQLCK